MKMFYLQTLEILSGNFKTLLLSFTPLCLPLHPILLIPMLFLHLPFFTSPHPLRPPSSRCTAGPLSLEELKVALISSPGFLQIVTEGASASERSILGRDARSASCSVRGKWCLPPPASVNIQVKWGWLSWLMASFPSRAVLDYRAMTLAKKDTSGSCPGLWWAWLGLFIWYFYEIQETVNEVFKLDFCF